MNSGLKNAATTALRPIISPTGTAQASATKKPIAIRRNDARMLSSVSGSERSDGSWRNAPHGGGNPLTAKARASASQINNNARHATSAERPGSDLRRAI